MSIRYCHDPDVRYSWEIGYEWQHPANEWWVVLRDRFSYEDMIVAKCSNEDEAVIVADLMHAENGDRHLKNSIETTYQVFGPPKR